MSDTSFDRGEASGTAQGEWLPIATAPKNGSDVLTRRAEWDRPRVLHYAWHYGVNDYCWCWPYERPDMESQPTHWTPLPPPPGSQADNDSPTNQ